MCLTRNRSEGYVRKAGLPPIADKQTEILILGTLPSDISLAAGRYYANPSNDFWKLVGAALDRNLVAVPYEERIEILQTHRIGLWDVYRNCHRPGSMDINIAERELNDFESLTMIVPNLKLVCFNGKEAGRAEGLLQQLGYSTRVLLSSSAAYRKDVPGRLRCWKNALNNQR